MSAHAQGTRRRMPALRAATLALAVAAALAASCGGGGGDDGGGGGGCERISEGPSNLTVQNNLPGGVRAFLPQFAFGADMFAGECNVIGLNARGTTSSIEVRLTRCNNTTDNSSCDGRLTGATRTVFVNLPQGGAATLTVTPAMF